MNHTATLLPNGKVLIAGGYYSTELSTAELYDPSTDTFATTGSMYSGRYGHTATLLHTGKVLVVGGRSGAGIYYSTAELYNPDTGTFSTTNSMSSARLSHTATLLHDGSVLVAGGYYPSSYLST